MEAGCLMTSGSPVVVVIGVMGGSATEIDPVAVDLVEGDELTISLKGKSSVKKTRLDLSVDVAVLTGGRLISDRWPVV